MYAAGYVYQLLPQLLLHKVPLLLKRQRLCLQAQQSRANSVEQPDAGFDAGNSRR
jgi:hypothetical protein